MKNATTAVAATILGSLLPSLLAAAQEVPRSTDVRVQEPSADVPISCRAFSGGWGNGKWSDGRTGELWVEKINSDCTAEVVYGWGPLPSSRSHPNGGFRRVKATITKDQLDLSLPEFSATVSYVLNGEQLRAVWQGVGGNRYSVSGVFHRIAAP